VQNAMRLFLLGSLVGFLFDRRDDPQESANVVGGHAAPDRLFEIGEVPVHAACDLQPLVRRGDHERPTVFRADLTRDEAAGGEAIEDAGQRRALVRETAMQLSDGGRRRRRKQRQDVPFSLRQAVVTQLRQIETDPVRRSVNGWNEAQ
jgi:hypothetical protein